MTRAWAVRPEPADALQLPEEHTAVVHGYATAEAGGFEPPVR